MNKFKGSDFHFGGQPALKPFSYGCVAIYFIHETESEIGLNIATTINRASAWADGCAKFWASRWNFSLLQKYVWSYFGRLSLQEEIKRVEMMDKSGM